MARPGCDQVLPAPSSWLSPSCGHATRAEKWTPVCAPEIGEFQILVNMVLYRIMLPGRSVEWQGSSLAFQWPVPGTGWLAWES